MCKNGHIFGLRKWANEQQLSVPVYSTTMSNGSFMFDINFMYVDSLSLLMPLLYHHQWSKFVCHTMNEIQDARIIDVSSNIHGILNQHMVSREPSKQ